MTEYTTKQTEMKTAAVTLSLEDDKKLECRIVAIYTAKNDRRYCALLPMEEDGPEVYLYRLVEEYGTPTLDNIPDDEEYAAAQEGFEDWLERKEMEAISP